MAELIVNLVGVVVMIGMFFFFLWAMARGRMK